VSDPLLLTSHARVLVWLARQPQLRIRDLALLLGTTERTAHKIVADLVRRGWVTRRRIGRRNEYAMNVDLRELLERELSAEAVTEPPDLPLLRDRPPQEGSATRPALPGGG
jgi:DNA-binding MarR family transcriptional regulator